MNPRLHSAPKECRAFSLVEVVIALAVTTFAVMAMIGLLGTGIHSGKESEDQIQAAGVASLIISQCAAAPTNAIANFILTPNNLTNALTTFGPGNIGLDGKITTVNPAYQVSGLAGTNTMTGSKLAEVYLRLTWPATASANNSAVGSYEVLTYIPLP